jgi:antitoxin component YwqK of YwqJK toxin-antitoxin module
MRLVGVVAILFLSLNIYSQNAINQVDGTGKKQGVWIKRDGDGRLVYQATFKDDKPVGEMKRYHLNGKVKAILNFAEDGIESEAQLFDEQGKPVASGKYLGQKKSGEWNYLLGSIVVLKENYQNGLKDGASKRYYATGELLEESEWKNDTLNGFYRTYFKDGKILLECKYEHGQRNGRFLTQFPSGYPEIVGNYTDDLRDKDWNYYDADGKLLYCLKFDSGKLLNPEVQDSIEKMKSEVYKTREDHVPDPEKFMQNPEEYMRLMQIR